MSITLLAGLALTLTVLIAKKTERAEVPVPVRSERRIDESRSRR